MTFAPDGCVRACVTDPGLVELVKGRLMGARPLRRDLQQAMAHVVAALDLLDGCDAPADIGAHLDLARCRLDDVLREQQPLDQRRADGFKIVA